MTVIEHYWFAINNAFNGVYQSIPSPFLWGIFATIATKRLLVPIHKRFDDLHRHVEKATGVEK